MKALKIVLAAVILLAGILTLNACQQLGSPIEGYNWVLTFWSHNGDTNILLSNTELSAFFNSKDHTVSGSGGCNHYSGTYKVDGLTLTVNNDIVIEQKFCSDAVNAQESAFIKALKNASDFRMDHGNLLMFCGSDQFQFKRENASSVTISQWGQ